MINDMDFPISKTTMNDENELINNRKTAFVIYLSGFLVGVYLTRE